MLDTDICSYLMWDNPPTLHKKFADHRDGLCIGSITFAELLYGAERKSSPKLLAQILRFVGILNVIEWDSEAARVYVVLRSRQESLGFKTGAPNRSKGHGHKHGHRRHDSVFSVLHRRMAVAVLREGYAEPSPGTGRARSPSFTDWAAERR
jgi:predicted nucleic acid-binding protein